MTLDLTLEDSRWTILPPLADRAISATLAQMGLDPEICEISLLGCDDERIAALNAEFRDKPAPTNVLSWPAEDLAAEEPGGEPLAPEADFTGAIPLGDIAIAFDTCQREAEAAGKPMDDHVTHLIVHGLLHLLGYDHIRDEDATLMEGLERRILGNLGLDDPYNME
ncbi:rRNA maturation RNase YbeY [Ruegeria pomeroyi]|uniref:rRNA maturation RNase YbeY n=1 Tax=Ruegeria pomeroyi TaxID=89184 RepID=UPI001F3F7424|nr:rRNA maturation RNase YbeY [Ruegeria pomeroyi]MCE8509134.1 rRNA maturation RNase YbeY [Ruegeria pomeroyi]MCE8516750.1 rRNA maturation RNase YbeY [Ruegeria pomeroyi]MCE8535420.1 rRNA maturation RNase YbeY [Ruegeria pomeroyi]MCE8556757.1 rRNA maturation RNase YbeY [Ruegeria pomeroyi]